jgi:hypothetical protein
MASIEIRVELDKKDLERNEFVFLKHAGRLIRTCDMTEDLEEKSTSLDFPVQGKKDLALKISRWV